MNKTNLTRQEKLAVAAKAQRREERTRKAIFGTVIIGVLAVVGIFFGIAINNANIQATEAALTPKNLTVDGAFRLLPNGSLATGEAVNAPAQDGAVRADLFFDPMCPGCGAVDRALGGYFAQLTANGEIDYYLHPVAFLDRTSNDKYSTRSVNALITVGESNPELFYAYMTEIFKTENQPNEGSEYRPVTDETLVQMAVNIGVPQENADLIKKRSYVKWIEESTKRAADKKQYFPEGLGTPALFFGGVLEGDSVANPTRVNLGGSEGMQAAVDNGLAAAKAKQNG